MAGRILDRLRPRNRRDAFGLALQVGSVIAFIVIVLNMPSLESANFFLWVFLAPAALVPAVVGMFIRRAARGESFFRF